MYNGGMTRFRLRIIPFIFLALVCAHFLWRILTPSCKTYDCISVSGKDLDLVDTYEDTGVAWRGLLRSGDMDIRLKVLHDIPRTQSDEITKIHLTAMLGLYDVALSPYPGAISHTIRCDEQFKPVPKKIVGDANQQVVYFAGFLNARTQYGSCIENQISYRSYAGIVYCEKQKKWVQIELIMLKDSPVSDGDGEGFIQRISCKK